MKLLILGGDRRVAYMAEKLAADGFAVTDFVTDIPEDMETAIQAAVRNADAIVGGLPFSKDGETVFAPFLKEPLSLSTLYACIRPGMPILIGKPGEEIHRKLIGLGAKVYDYFEEEAVALLNAVPTAEGAIELAMQHLPVTLWETECLVAGYGRIGKYLAHLLKMLGARVTVSARKEADFAKCRMLGHRAVHTDSISETALRYRVIFNTIPHKVFSRKVLSSLRPDCLLIDLASLPGGVDMEAAAEKGTKVLRALSLPGKVAPETAGEILCGTVQSILRERN